MNVLRSLAIGSTLGWCCVTTSTVAIGVANLGTLAAALLPIGLWTVALLTERAKEVRMRRAASAPVED